MFREPTLPKKILISGAGIAGLVLARQLKKFGIPFKIIEKRPCFSDNGTGIALPANALAALRYVGLGSHIDQYAHQVNKIIYTDSTGLVLSEASLLEKPLNADKFVALHHHTFHEILRKGMDNIIHFDTTITAMKPTRNGILVTFNNAQQEEFSLVIGADGVNSLVRQFAFLDASLIDLGVTIWRWTCKYPTHSLQPTYMLGLHDVFMAYPISENEVYCYAHAFDPGNFSFQSSNHKENLIKQFSQYGGIAKIMLSILPENQLILPGRLRSVSKAFFTSKRVALIGDASHACSPMLQQGAACALEDVIALSELLEAFSIEEALSHYEKFRTERVNWIMTSSDVPMKMLIDMHPPLLTAIQNKIREEGPLNVQGWKKLLLTNPLAEIKTYIEKNKHSKEEKSHHMAKL